MSTASTFAMIKKNAVSFVTLFTFVSTVIGGYIAFDSTYARASEVASLKSYVKQSREYDNWVRDQNQSKSRQHQLMDQIYILKLKPHPTQQDTATIGYYQQQLDAINADLAKPAPPEPTD